MGERRGVYRVWVGKPEGKDLLVDPAIEGRTLLRWILRKWNIRAWTGSMWLRIGTVAGTHECSNEPSGSIKCGQFLD
jgi:hypothetical protein